MAYEALNRLDFPLDRWLNGQFGKHAAFDGLVGFVSGNELISGALLMSVFWWAWYRRPDLAERRRDREHVLATLFAGGLAFFLARVLVFVLPFRSRPRLEPALNFVLPPSWNAALTTDWSSFPCDLAMMGAALAVGLCFVSRRVGLLIGAALGCLLNQPALRGKIAGPFLEWEARAPAGFYLALFLLSYEFATQFTSVRAMAGTLARAAHRMLGLH
jgi:F0F1-type ATP synthase membrane subunit c/vacuolar-type H+-ATPase subunit K